MFVKLSAAGSVTLEDRDNFRAFKLVVEGGPDRLDTPAARCPAPPNCPTRPPPGSSSRRCGSGPRSRRTPRGKQNLGTMMEKAKPHGWIDEQKKAIKAHIEWTEKP